MAGIEAADALDIIVAAWKAASNAKGWESDGYVNDLHTNPTLVAARLNQILNQIP